VVQARKPEAEGTGDLHTDRQVINMGPSHPATHGTVKILLEVDGEEITDMEVMVGYLHRGFEKECESGTWYQAIPYTDRLNYNSAILANLGYCMAVEKLLGVELPERCLWVRTLAAEISRISDHLTRLGAACLELGAMTPFLYGIEARELTYDLQEALCGARVTTNYVRIGGLQRQVPDGFEDLLEATLVRIEELLLDFDKVITANRIFVDRFRNTGILSRERLIEYAVTGPLLRAAGIPLDLRKAEPYLAYDQIDFDVPIGTIGDNYDRFLVCQEEVVQSIRIIRQCAVAMRESAGEPVDVDDPKIRWPGRTRRRDLLRTRVRQRRARLLHRLRRQRQAL
jgi:NADH-quinone oxidoreductase subunit D